MKKLRLPVAVGFALGSALTYGQNTTLGAIQVNSYQGQNLNASINIHGLTSAQAKNVKVNLANNSEYAKRGVKKTPDQSKMNFRVVPTKSGYRIAVGSNAKMEEGFVNFVVTVSGAGEQNIVREYSVFLEKNPNDILNNAIVEKGTTAKAEKPEKGKKGKKKKEVEPQVAKTDDGKSRVWLSGQEVNLTDQTVAVANNNNYVNNAETPELVEKPKKKGARDLATTTTNKNGDIVYKVARGDSLTRIAKRFKPKDMPLDEAKEFIFNNNRHAFSSDKETSLMAGYKLTIAKDFKVATEQGAENQQENTIAQNQEAQTPATTELPAENKATETTVKNEEPAKTPEPETKTEETKANSGLVLDTVDSVGEVPVEQPKAEEAKPEPVVENKATETPKTEEPEEVKPAEEANKETATPSPKETPAPKATQGNDLMAKAENLIKQYLPENLAKKDLAGLPMWQVVLFGGGFLVLLLLLLILKALFGKKKDDDYADDAPIDISKAAEEYDREQERLEKVKELKAKITAEKEKAEVDEAVAKVEEEIQTAGFEEPKAKENFKEEDFLEVKEEEGTEDITALTDLDLEIADQKELEDNLAGGIIAADVNLDKDEVIELPAETFEAAKADEKYSGEEDFFDELTKEGDDQVKAEKTDLTKEEIDSIPVEDFIEEDLTPPVFDEGKEEAKTEAVVEQETELALPDLDNFIANATTAPADAPVEEVKQVVEPELPEEANAEVKLEEPKAKLTDFSIDLPEPKTKAEAKVAEMLAATVEPVKEVVEEVKQEVKETVADLSTGLEDLTAGSEEALILEAQDFTSATEDFDPSVKFDTLQEQFQPSPAPAAVDAKESTTTHELDSFQNLDEAGSDLVVEEDNFADIQTPAAPTAAPVDNAFNEADIGAMNINLDLAAAYIDAGIKLDKAKAWLDEVLQKGADIQKQKAADLMEKLKAKQ